MDESQKKKRKTYTHIRIWSEEFDVLDSIAKENKIKMPELMHKLLEQARKYDEEQEKKGV